MSLTPQIDMDAQAHDWSRGRNDVLALIQQQPGNAKAFYDLAQFDVRLGNLAEARDALAKANNLDPARTFVGNFADYNKLSGYLNASQQVAMVRHPAPAMPHQHSSNAGVWIAVACAMILVLIVTLIVVAIRSSNRRNDDRMARLQREIEASRVRDSYARSHTHTGTRERSRSSCVDPHFGVPSPSPRYAAAPAAPYYPPAAPQTVVHTSGGNDMLTGMLVGEMLSDHGSREVIREREVYHDSSPAPSFDYGSSSSSSSDSGGFDVGSSSSDSGSFGGGDW